MADIINGETIAGTITEAAKLTNIDRQTVYNQRNQDKYLTHTKNPALGWARRNYGEFFR